METVVPSLTVFSPRAHQVLESNVPNKLASLEGITLGLLCNSKPNAQVLLDAVAAGIGEKVALGRIVRARKPVPSEPATVEVYATLAEECGAVIFATAD
jgi:hypothetical protein